MTTERILRDVAACLDAGQLAQADELLFQLQIAQLGGLVMEEHECDREYALRVRLMKAKIENPCDWESANGLQREWGEESPD